MHPQPELVIPSRRPMRDLFLQLPLLLVNAEHEIDYAASDPAVLVQIAMNAKPASGPVQRGLSCIGHLLTRADRKSSWLKIPATASRR